MIPDCDRPAPQRPRNDATATWNGKGTVDGHPELAGRRAIGRPRMLSQQLLQVVEALAGDRGNHHLGNIKKSKVGKKEIQFFGQLHSRCFIGQVDSRNRHDQLGHAQRMQNRGMF